MPTTPSSPSVSTAQDTFDRTYITSTEIISRLGITRNGIAHARRRGMLPDPIVVNDGQLYLWERDAVRPYLDAWALWLSVRRGGGVAA